MSALYHLQNLLRLTKEQKKFAIFRKAYGFSKKAFAQTEQVFRILSMLSSFDKLRWAIDNHVDTADYFTKAKENFENFNISAKRTV